MANNNIIWIIAAVAVVIFVMNGQKTQPATTTTLPPDFGTNGGIEGCNSEPSISLTCLNALVPGTSLTCSASAYRVDDNYMGTSTPTVKVGQKVELIATNLTYVDQIFGPYTIKCGNNPIVASVKQYDNATVSIKTDAGTNVLSNIGSAWSVNDTAFGVGGTKNWEISLTGVGQKTSGDIFMVLETPTGSSSNVTQSGIAMSCGGVALAQDVAPGSLASTNSNNLRVAYTIPAIDGGVKKTCNLQVTTVAAKNLGGRFYAWFMPKQAYVDTDGTFKKGVYDTNGNAKYQDFYNYSWHVGG